MVFFFFFHIEVCSLFSRSILVLVWNYQRHAHSFARRSGKCLVSQPRIQSCNLSSNQTYASPISNSSQTLIHVHGMNEITRISVRHLSCYDV